MKIKKLYDKEKFVIHIITLKQASSRGLILKKAWDNKIQSENMTKIIYWYEYLINS